MVLFNLFSLLLIIKHIRCLRNKIALAKNKSSEVDMPCPLGQQGIATGAPSPLKYSIWFKDSCHRVGGMSIRRGGADARWICPTLKNFFKS